jgi:hypothetical protein
MFGIEVDTLSFPIVFQPLREKVATQDLNE